MNDWIKLYRSIEGNEFYFAERFTKTQAWIDLLLLATWKPRTVFIRGVEVNLHPGELCYSQLSLAKRWKWNVKTVSAFLSMLRKRQMLETKTDNVTTVISIKNWNRYQSNGEQSGDQNGEQKETRTETNKKDKKGKKGKEINATVTTEKSSKSVSPVEVFRKWWAEEYERRFSVQYVFNFGKEGKLIKTLLDAVGGDAERLKAKALTFFESSDEFLHRAGYTIGVFYSRFNSIRPTDGEVTKPKDAALTQTQKFYMEQTT